MDDWVGFYERVLGFENIVHYDDEQIHTEYSALMSKVMADGEGKIKFPINEPAEGRRKSQIEEYLEYNAGPGVQHVAIQTDDIVGTVEAMQERGVPFLTTPEAYYEDAFDRVGEIEESWGDLRRLRILVDRDEDGLPAPDLHEADAGPADAVLRGDPAPRRAHVRRGQLQGAVRGDRARAGSARQPVRADAATLRLAVFPRPSLLTDTLLVLAGTGLVALSAQISVKLPFTPVPITGQTFAVCLVGAVARRDARGGQPDAVLSCSASRAHRSTPTTTTGGT